VARIDDLAHIDMARVGVSLCRSRAAGRHGLQATLTPLRFAGGARVSRRRGRHYRVERCLDQAGRELLYVLSLYLPRFCENPWREKLVTIVHELWHIGPRFDGDLRRFSGRCFAHGRSQRAYDEQVSRLAERWLAADPPAELLEFLRHDFDELCRRFTTVHGTHYRLPKLILVDAK
jgi:predicted metallopeptidase